MKKIIMSFGVVAFIAATSSCSKDRVCTCTYTSTEVALAGLGNYTNVTEFPNSSKQAAKTACAIYANDGNGKRQVMAATVIYEGGVSQFTGEYIPAYTEAYACDLK